MTREEIFAKRKRGGADITGKSTSRRRKKKKGREEVVRVPSSEEGKNGNFSSRV